MASGCKWTFHNICELQEAASDAASDILRLKESKPLTFAFDLCQEEPEVLGAQTCPTFGGKPRQVRFGNDA